MSKFLIKRLNVLERLGILSPLCLISCNNDSNHGQGEKFCLFTYMPMFYQNRIVRKNRNRAVGVGFYRFRTVQFFCNGGAYTP